VKKHIPAIILIAIAASAVMSAIHAPATKADSKVFVYLPLVTNGSNGQTTEPTTTPTTTPTPTVDAAQLKADAIAAVNAERAKAGCAPVAEEASLAAAAQAWSDYMVANNYINHSDTVDINWYLDHGYTRTDWLSENINVGAHSGADVVTLWMSDEGHKAAILAGCANTTHTFDIGIGFNNYCWTLAIGELYN